MISKDLLSSSVNEILGIYSPGAAPTVKETKGISIDITLAHEEGHRELTDTTSLGQYMKLLGFAVEFGKTPELKKSARMALVETVEQCWSVQEGYATCRQIAYCYGLNRPDVTRHVWENLPAAYVNACNQFPLDVGGLRYNIAVALGEKSPARHDMLRIGLSNAAYVIARAAMSIPLAQVLRNATSLPSYETSVAIRRQSPDVRLQTLGPKLTLAFSWKCLTVLWNAGAETTKVGTPRPLDDQLDKLAREVCDEAGLPYEPSYAVDINELQRKFEGGLGFYQRDARDVPYDETESYRYNMDVVGKDVSHLKSIPIETAEYAYKDILSKMFGRPKPHVVCELAARSETDGTVAWLHVYATRDEVVNHLNHNNEHEKARVVAANHPDTAQLLLILPLSIIAAGVPKLIEWFPHRSWAWVVGDVLMKGLKGTWSLPDLQETGEVFAVPVSIIASNDRRIKSTYALPKSAEVADAKRAQLGYLENVTESAVLVVFQDDPDLPDAKLVRIAAIDYLKSENLTVAPFEDACVAETLLHGFYSTHIFARRLKGTADESTDS